MPSFRHFLQHPSYPARCAYLPDIGRCYLAGLETHALKRICQPLQSPRNDNQISNSCSFFLSSSALISGSVACPCCISKLCNVLKSTSRTYEIIASGIVKKSESFRCTGLKLKPLDGSTVSIMKLLPFSEEARRQIIY